MILEENEAWARIIHNGEIVALTSAPLDSRERLAFYRRFEALQAMYPVARANADALLIGTVQEAGV